jgi:hypothetical protein
VTKLSKPQLVFSGNSTRCHATTQRVDSLPLTTVPPGRNKHTRNEGRLAAEMVSKSEKKVWVESSCCQSLLREKKRGRRAEQV